MRCFSALLLFLICLPAGRLWGFDLIESQVIDAPVIVRAVVTDSQTLPGASSTELDVRITLEIVDVFKGDLPEPSLEISIGATPKEAQQLANYRSEMLLFLAACSPAPAGAPKYALQTRVLLANPPPGEASDDLRTLDLQPLTPAQILAATRLESARKATATEVRWIHITAFRGAPFEGLFVPDDAPRMDGAIRRWLDSPDPWIRVLALNALQEFKLPDRGELAGRFLNDPSLTPHYAGYSPWSRNIYFVRMAAAAISRDTGAPVDNVGLNDGQSPYGRIHFAWPFWVIVLAVLGMYIVLRRRKRGIRRSLFLSGTLACTLFAAIFTALWIRSFSAADDFFYSGYGHILSATTRNGSLQLLAASGFQIEQPLCHVSLQPDELLGDFFSGGEAYFWHGFGSSMGIAPPPVTSLYADQGFHDTTISSPIGEADGHREDLPATVSIIPLRYFVPFLYAPAALWLSLFGVSHIRRRYRRTHSLCPLCGYDLRASQARCPECGLATVAPMLPGKRGRR